MVKIILHDSFVREVIISCGDFLFIEPCVHNFICIVKHTPKQMYCTKAVSSDEVKNGCITFDDKFEMYDLNMILIIITKEKNSCLGHMTRATLKVLLPTKNVNKVHELW